MIIGVEELEDDYITWRQNKRANYDYLWIESLAWPSITTQWLPVNEM